MLPLVDIARRLDGLAKGATRGGAMQSASRTVTAPAKPIAAPSTNRQVLEPPSQSVQLYDVEQPAALWAALLEQLGTQQVRLQLGRSIRQSFQPPSALLATFPAGGEAARDYCCDSNRSAKLEEMLKKLTGKQLALRFEIEANGEAVVNVPKAVQQRQTALLNPLAKAIMEQLSGQLVHIDEGFGG